MTDKEKKELAPLAVKVLGWGIDKGIVNYDNVGKQYMKFIEEVGELSSSILKGKDEEEVMDAVGDTAVTIILLAACVEYSNWKNPVEQITDIVNVSIENAHSEEEKYDAPMYIFRVVSGASDILDTIIVNILTNFYLSQCLVNLIRLCDHLGVSFYDSLLLAYNTIALRKGKNVNGVFIKEEDLK